MEGVCFLAGPKWAVVAILSKFCKVGSFSNVVRPYLPEVNVNYNNSGQTAAMDALMAYEKEFNLYQTAVQLLNIDYQDLTT